MAAVLTREARDMPVALRRRLHMARDLARA
jgi:hypothetical protein